MKHFKTLLLTLTMALAGLASWPATAQEAQPYSQAELDQMLAPIALYPDTVLSHVLIAATYPLEVVQAARWSRNNPGLSGQDAVDRVENQDWDPSVKALVAFPELLQRMDQDIAWTQSLGDAFLAQEGEVTDSIQYLRNQAYSNGQLQSNQQVNVVRETRYIYIEPARPQVVYVPYYDPRVVYGPWRWAAYPPVYWHHPPGFSLSLGFHWGVGFHVQSSFFFSSFYWPSRHVVVVDHHYHNRYPNYGYRKGHGHYRPGYNMAHYDGAHRWKHNQQHRRGVSYRDGVHRERFSQHDGGRGRDHASRGQAPQTRGMQRDWADRQRSRFVDNTGGKTASPLRSERPGNSSSGYRSRDSGRDGNRSATGGGRDSGSPRDANARRIGRDESRTRPDRSAARTTAQNPPRSKDAGSNRSVLPPASQPTVRLSDRGAGPAISPNTSRDTSRNISRNTSPTTGRNISPAVRPDSRPNGGPGSGPQRAARAGSESRERPVNRPGRESSPQRQTQYLAAAPQRQSRAATSSPRAVPQQRVEPRRQVETPRSVSPSRQQAPAQQQSQAYQARPAQASRPERAAKNMQSESRQGEGRNERRAQDRGSRGRERSSRN
jgi:hypothetical protein